MTDGKPSDRRRTRTRQDIIDATHEMIVTGGVEGLSIRAIAEQIDYSPAALYRYFGSKDELIDAVRAQCFERLNAALMVRLMGAGSIADQVLAAGLAYLEFARDYPTDYHLMFHLEPSASTQAENQQQAMQALLFMVRTGIESGAFVTSADYDETAIAYHCWSTVHGLAMLRTTVMRDEQAVFDRVSEVILRKVIDSFLAF
ncbi:MAG: TetR/AcrR family transcriptional regulator [Chloroflexi bacterium]|nr:TetR/AcrR family transcriptional regulator [Chloroflexota bacterium]